MLDSALNRRRFLGTAIKLAAVPTLVQALSMGSIGRAFAQAPANDQTLRLGIGRGQLWAEEGDRGKHEQASDPDDERQVAQRAPDVVPRHWFAVNARVATRTSTSRRANATANTRAIAEAKAMLPVAIERMKP